jgi:hypothetical protein
MNTAPETYRSRSRKYRRREQMTIWIGAAYAALIALMTTKVFEQSNVPAALNALLVTLILLGGWCLGRARVGFEWAATQLERTVEDGLVQTTDPLPPTDLWPAKIETYWLTSLVIVAIAAAAMLIAVWWNTIESLT